MPKASKPREVVQMDTMDFGEIFAFNGIDIFTREVIVVLGDNLTTQEGSRCVKRIFESLGPCQLSYSLSYSKTPSRIKSKDTSRSGYVAFALRDIASLTCESFKSIIILSKCLK